MIENPGQVPIYFEIYYAAERIEDWRTYAVQAVIEDRGELAFINDTAYDVITYGQPTHVDMALVMVDSSPSPPSASQAAWVQGVAINRDDEGYSLEVSFTLPDYCSRFDGYDLSVVGSGIEVALDIADLSAGGSVACAQAIQELSANIPIEAAVEAGGELYGERERGSDQFVHDAGGPERGGGDGEVAGGERGTADNGVVSAAVQPVYRIGAAEGEFVFVVQRV